MRTTSRVALATAIFLAAAGVSLLLPVGPAAACTCAGARTDAERLETADAVFTGTLTSRTDAPAVDGRTSTADPARLEFEVDAVYKGAVTRNQQVVTAREDMSCGLVTYLHTRYVVFAKEGSTTGREAPELAVGACDGTRPITADPTELGAARVPLAPVDRPSEAEDGSNLVVRAAPVALLGAVVGGGVWAWSRRRRRPGRASA